MQNDTFPNDLFPSASIGSSGLSFLRTVPTRPEKTLGLMAVGDVFWDFLNFCVPSTLFFKSSLRPWKDLIQRYLVVVEVMAVTLGVLHLRKVYNQKPCHKNPSRKKTGSKSSIIPNTFSYKHLQKPLETPTLHLHGVPSPPHSLAKCHNLQKIHPSDRGFS